MSFSTNEELAPVENGRVLSFCNPVFDRSFPDPFVIKFCGEYFGFATGFGPDGRVFPVIRSSDLVNWELVGSAMDPIASQPPYYWAPEAVYYNGKFYLYYSCGNETLMEIRVAVSERPDGGFVDSGHVLTTEEFAIDAHVFVDSDGERYLFYATDFLEHTHIGTGTVVDRMIDPFTLAGDPVPVTRAKFDWQVYDPNRAEKGGVRWHTVEGPTVLERKGKYFEMFSGGNWQNDSYGVSYAVSPTIISANEWEQSADGDSIHPIMKTMPGSVIGPGHNSVVVGPNNRELYCVYHSWVGSERVMAIDRMGFAGERIFIAGPTSTDQPSPHSTSKQTWLSSVDGNEITGTTIQLANSGVLTDPLFTDLLSEVNFRFVETNDRGSFAIALSNEHSTPLEIKLRPTDGILMISVSTDGQAAVVNEGTFTPNAFHHLLLEINGRTASIKLDDLTIHGADLSPEFDKISIFADNSSVEIVAPSVTYGFDDLFYGSRAESSLNEWAVVEGEAKLSAHDALLVRNSSDSPATVVRGEVSSSYEFQAAVCTGDHESDAAYGFALLNSSGTDDRKLLVTRGQSGWQLTNNGEPISELPKEFDPQRYQHYTFSKRGDVLRIESEDALLGHLKINDQDSVIGIVCTGPEISVDMARLTYIAP
jgi:GH43 family beta-xylosidase